MNSACTSEPFAFAIFLPRETAHFTTQLSRVFRDQVKEPPVTIPPAASQPQLAEIFRFVSPWINLVRWAETIEKIRTHSSVCILFTFPYHCCNVVRSLLSNFCYSSSKLENRETPHVPTHQIYQGTETSRKKFPSPDFLRCTEWNFALARNRSCSFFFRSCDLLAQFTTEKLAKLPLH